MIGTDLVISDPRLTVKWTPSDRVGEMTGRLVKYLDVHSGYSHHCAGEDLFTTDGSLRKVGCVSSIGSVVVHEETR